MTEEDKQVLASIDDLSDLMARSLNKCIKLADYDGFADYDEFDDVFFTMVQTLRTIKDAYTSLIKENDELKGEIVSLWKANTELIKGGWGQ